MKIVVLIVNCLNCSSTPLSYTNTRSVYTSEERLKQLINSITSVYKYIPQADIIVCESSQLLDYQISELEHLPGYGTKLLMHTIDKFKDAQRLAMYRDGPHKGLAELFQLCEVVESNMLSSYDYVFKLSGRYEITENFNIDNVDFSKFYCFYFPEYTMFSTVLYGVPMGTLESSSDGGVPMGNIDMYHQILKGIISRNLCTSIEGAIFQSIDTKLLKIVYSPEKFGARGLVSVIPNGKYEI